MSKSELWKSRIAEFRASDQSAVAWCEAQGLKAHQLYYWIHKFKTEDESSKEQTKWVSVEIGELEVNQPQKALPVRVGKATIEVHSGFDPKLLSEVVKTLAFL